MVHYDLVLVVVAQATTTLEHAGLEEREGKVRHFLAVLGVVCSFETEGCNESYIAKQG